MARYAERTWEVDPGAIGGRRARAVATQSTVIGISSHDKSHLSGYFQ
jgi:hypothetical protein